MKFGDLDLRNQDHLDLIWIEYKKLMWIGFCLFKTFAKSIIYYYFLIWIFLGIFDRYGFERTLIILLIGIFYVRVKKSWDQ